MRQGWKTFIFALFVGIAACAPGEARAQSASVSAAMRTGAPLVYVDCRTWGCDHDFFRSEITFVNYVRDRTAADIHVLVTAQNTGGGGRQYMLNFIGQNEFQGQADTLTYTALQSATDDDRRRGLAHTIKLGLIRYAAQSSLADAIRIEFDAPDTSSTGDNGEGSAENIQDPWDHWVFDIGADGSADLESQQREIEFGLNFSADRTTAEWIMSFNIGTEYTQERFEFDDDVEEEISRQVDFRVFFAKSFGPHLSFGLRGGFEHAPGGENHERSFDLGPAIEFSVFPYAQSNRRQLRIQYSTAFDAVAYQELTVFNRLEDRLYEQELSVSYAVAQPWGSIGVGVSGSHYFSHPDKYNVRLNGQLDIQLTSNLSFRVDGDGSLVKDQFALPLDEVEAGDCLVGRCQLPTSYEARFSLGLGYTFGSIFNNVVNTRFDEVDDDD